MGKRLQNLTIPNATMPTGNRKLREEWGSELYDVVKYHDFKRVRLNGVSGTLFTTDCITHDVRALTGKYSNVVILAGHTQYAPEITRGHVFVADRALTN